MKVLFLGGSQHLKLKELESDTDKYTTIHAGNEVIDFPGEPLPAKRPDKVKREVYTKRKISIPSVYVLEDLGNINFSEMFMEVFNKLLEVYNEKAEQTLNGDQAKESSKEEPIEERKSPAKSRKLEP